MAGKKQHYIPQCLLRAFAARSTPKRDYVYVFNNFKDPFLSPTEDVASQRYFYSDESDDGARSLDDIITDYESYLAPRLVSLRNAEHDASVESRLASEVVAHLTIRAAYLRDIFGMAARGIIDVFEEVFRDPVKLRSMMGVDAPRPSAPFSRALEEELDQIVQRLPGQPTIPRSFLEEIAIALIREQFSASHASNLRMTTELLEEIKHRMPEIVKSAHRDALGKALVPQERIEALKKYLWSVYVESSAHLVLPDCVTLAVGANGIYAPYVGNNLDETDCVLLPLSPRRVLVGKRHQSAHYSPEHFNRHAARSSSRFFVSSTTSADLVALTAGIGSHAKSALEGAIASARTSIGSSGSPDSKEAGRSLADTLELQIRFDPSINRATALHIAEVIKAVLGQMMRIANLSKLDAIVCVEDFGGEFARLGLPKHDTADALAAAPIANVNGDARATILLKPRLALMLVQPDERQMAAAHVLVSLLARTDLAARIDASMPGILTRPAENSWDGVFGGASFDLLVAYHAARLSAPFFPSIIGEYQQDFLLRMQNARQNVPAARTRFVLDKDVAAFLNVAIPCVGSVLQQLARIVGYYDADSSASASPDDGVLRGALDEIGLWLWLDSYQRDLRHLADRCEWRAPNDLLRISVHVRRWFLAFGVACWRSEDGNVWLYMNDVRPSKVPFGSAG